MSAERGVCGVLWCVRECCVVCVWRESAVMCVCMREECERVV